MLEGHHLLAAVTVEPRGQTVRALGVSHERTVLVARQLSLHLKIVFERVERDEFQTLANLVAQLRVERRAQREQKL